MTTVLTVLGIVIGFGGGFLVGRRNHLRSIRTQLLVSVIPDLLDDLTAISRRPEDPNVWGAIEQARRLQWTVLALTRLDRKALDQDALDGFRATFARWEAHYQNDPPARLADRQGAIGPALETVTAFRAHLARRLVGRRVRYPAP